MNTKTTLAAVTVSLRAASFHPNATDDTVRTVYLDQSGSTWIRETVYEDGTTAVLAHPYGSRNGYECATVQDAKAFLLSEYNVSAV